MATPKLSICQISETGVFIDAAAYKGTLSNDNLQDLINVLDLNIRKGAYNEQLSPFSSIAESVPGMFNLTLFLSQNQDVTALKNAIEYLWKQNLNKLTSIGRQELISESQIKEIVIPTIYGLEGAKSFGPDLTLVAKHNQLKSEQVVKIHSQTLYQVYFIGFQPGFAYLGGLDSRLYTPRKAQPREKISKGSVAIGGQQTGIYPAATPGGWQIIGQTQVPLFDACSSEQTCLLQSGDRVRFQAVNQGD